MGDIVITRGKCLWMENEVEVRMNGKTVRVDPQQLALHATGKILSREQCITSFADGLIGAGHTVFMVYPKQNRHRTGRYLQQPKTVLIYYVLGYATGRGECVALMSDLHRFVSSYHREEALARVGERVLRYRTPATLF